jgi:hypothetical protein
MSIPVKCSCGKTIQAQPEHAGKRIRCPDCKAIVSVPAPEVPVEVAEVAEVAEQGYDVAKVRKCPGCRREWPANTVICVECGYNFETGKQLKTTFKVRDHYTDVGSPALGIYTRFAVQRDKQNRASLVKRSWFLWIPFGTSTVDLAGYDTVATDFGLVNRHEFWFLELQGPKKKPLQIYAGQSEQAMQNILDVLKEGAGLTITRR